MIKKFVRVTAAQVVFHLLQAYGTDENEEKDSNQEDNSDDDTGNAGKSILNVLMILLDSEVM